MAQRANTIKLLEENIEENFLDVGFGKYDTKSMGNKRENRHIRLHQNLKLLCLRGLPRK